jgi:hypothetical protein
MTRVLHPAHDVPGDSADQTRTPFFRAVLLIQVAVGGLFGLVPFAVPAASADLSGFTGAEPFIYRLAGAASLGYAVAAGVALANARWHQLRIPMVATLVFNLSAVVAALLSVAEGDRQFVVFLILVAAAAFSLVSAYWLVRNEGPPPPSDDPGIAGWFHVALAAATAAALIFGLGPLLVPQQLAEFGGFADADRFVYRMAGAATLGYAVAGVLQIRAHHRAEIGLQVVAALVFNALSAVAAILYVAGGGRSLVAFLILGAAAFFSLVFAVWLTHGGRPRSTA